MPKQLLLVGIVGKAQGLDGAVFVRAFNQDSPIWQARTSFAVLTAEQLRSAGQNVDVVAAEPSRTLALAATFTAAKGRLCARFDGVRFRDQAESLRDVYLAIPVEDLGDPDEDEFFYHEVKGWSVVNTDSVAVGTVTNVVSTYVDMLEVAPESGGETFFIPCVEEIVTEIDRANTRIVIDPPDGLVP